MDVPEESDHAPQKAVTEPTKTADRTNESHVDTGMAVKTLLGICVLRQQSLHQ